MNKLFILIAYPFFTKHVFEVFKTKDPEEYELIIDSGAFSAFVSGRTIKLKDYHSFLDQVKCLPLLKAIQLDVMGNEEKTWANFIKSKNAGYDVAPVFTRGTDIKEIEKMYEYSNLVFIGATGGPGGKNYVKYVLERNKGRDCHLLGNVNTKLLKYFKPYSCDVSSWTAAARYGVMDIYKGGGEILNVPKKDFIKRPKPDVLKLLSKLGFTFDEIKLLSKRESWVNTWVNNGALNGSNLESTAQFFTTVTWVYRQYQIYKNLGTKLFMAVGAGSGKDLSMVFHARDFLKRRGVI